jgi:hypothetical protein
LKSYQQRQFKKPVNKLVIFSAAFSEQGECKLGEPTMESDHRYYSRRAAQEKMAAARAISAKARAWHRQLAEDFVKKAQQLHELSTTD